VVAAAQGAYGLDEVTADGVQALLTGCRSLTSVDFGGCHRISSQQIDAMAKAFPAIRF
jgi:hypothetical protein